MTHESPEQRAARRIAEAASVATQRRQATPLEYVYDKAQEAFWDLEDRTLNSAEAVDASIPLALWRVEEARAAPPPAEGEPRRAGRPAGAARERRIKPSVDISRVENDQFVESSTWWPGKPQIISGFLVNEEGTREAPGRRVYNQYSPPPPARGNPEEAGEWVALVKKMWPEALEHNYFLDYCAHMVQRPEEKCNFAVVLSGEQGIGKDTVLDPVRAAVGNWNCKAINADDVFNQYAPWKQTVMLIVNEIRPSSNEHQASAFYNIMKEIISSTAGGTISMNEKYVKMRHVVNVMRVFMTTNDHLSLRIESTDRRLLILHSPLRARWDLEEGRPEFFVEFYDWLGKGGEKAVAAFLAARDLSDFRPKAPPPRTRTWEAIAGSWGEPDDAVKFALEAIGNPEVFFGVELLDPQFDDYESTLAIMKSPRRMAHRMSEAGYVEFAHPTGLAHWNYVSPEHGGRIRSRRAYVKEDTKMGPGDIYRELEKRGKELCEKKGAGR